MFPIETLAKEYVVVPPVQVPNDALDKAQVWRVIASEANTTLTFTPDQPVGKVLVNAGDFVEMTTNTAKFVVTYPSIRLRLVAPGRFSYAVPGCSPSAIRRKTLAASRC